MRTLEGNVAFTEEYTNTIHSCEFNVTNIPVTYETTILFNVITSILA